MANINYLRDTTAQGLAAMAAPQRSRDLLAPRLVPQNAGAAAMISTGQQTATGAFWEIAIPLSVAASTYHGYKRHSGSLGWALGWGVLGGLFPIITPAVALAQGFGKPGPR